MTATHNRESTALLARLLQERGLKEKAANVYFAQLYGMSDNLTYNLADAGYHVVKYVPYGAVKTMMLAKYLKKKFFPELQKIHYNSLKKRHKGKLDCTNNQIENYIGNTMPKAHKKKFRTLEGIFNQIMHQKDGWIEKRKQELTN